MAPRDIRRPDDIAPRKGICPRCRAETLEIDPAKGTLRCRSCGFEMDRPMAT